MGEKSYYTNNHSTKLKVLRLGNRGIAGGGQERDSFCLWVAEQNNNKLALTAHLPCVRHFLHIFLTCMENVKEELGFLFYRNILQRKKALRGNVTAKVSELASGRIGI